MGQINQVLWDSLVFIYAVALIMKISFIACASIPAIRFCWMYRCRTACRPP